MSQVTFTIRRLSDERTTILLNDQEVCQLSHDEDGWSGMDKCEQLVVRIARLIGAQVEHTEAWGGEG